MSSFQSFDELDMSETDGPLFQMPDQTTFKSLVQKNKEISYSMPHFDFGTYRRNTLKSQPPNSKKLRRGKTSTTNVIKPDNSKISLIDNVKLHNLKD